LVEAPLPQPQAVERHRNDEVGLRQELGAGPRHHGAQSFGQLDPVAVFQPVDEGAGRSIVVSRRAGALENRRIGHGGRRQEGHPEVHRERGAEALAIGPLDQSQARPAARA
jgi:hypothetical protein